MGRELILKRCARTEVFDQDKGGEVFLGDAALPEFVQVFSARNTKIFVDGIRKVVQLVQVLLQDFQNKSPSSCMSWAFRNPR